MSLRVRIFSPTIVGELELADEKKTYTIGSSENDTLMVPGCGLPEARLSFRYDVSRWVCVNSAVPGGTAQPIEGREFYELSEKGGVAAFVYLPETLCLTREPVKVSGKTILVGSHKLCQIRLTHATVSKTHAIFSDNGEKCRLLNCGSTHGTYLNRKRLLEDAVLENNDLISIGVYDFRYADGVLSFCKNGLSGHAAPTVDLNDVIDQVGSK